MPMPLSAILMFEKLTRCSINIYQLENSRLLSVYHSTNRKGRHKIDLLRLLENKNSHYCLIKKNISNLIHFLCRSKSKQNKGPKSRFCRNCFQPIVKPNFKKYALFSRAAPHSRFECLSSYHLSGLLVGEKHSNLFLLYILISKETMLRHHRLRKRIAGQEKLNDSMQLVWEQSSLTLGDRSFIKILDQHILRLHVSANYRREHFLFIQSRIYSKGNAKRSFYREHYRKSVGHVAWLGLMVL